MAFIPVAIAAVTLAAATPAPASRPAAPAAATAASGSTLGPASYDARWKVIVVPYTGAVPTYTMGTLDNPPRVFFDFKGRFTGGFPAGTPTAPNVARWAMAPRGPETTRLTLTFDKPTQVKVMHNARRRVLVLVPQPVGAQASPAPGRSPAPQASASPAAVPSPAASIATVFGAPRYDAERQAVVLPYRGAVPAHFSESLTNPPRVYFDFEGAYPLRNIPGGTVTGHPLLTRWILSPRDRDTTRVTLTFTEPARVLLKPDEARHELLLIPQPMPSAPAPAASPTAKPAATPKPRPSVTPTPRPTARPSQIPSQVPTLTPPRLEPSEKPTPLDTP
ncbi:hypothetical protein D3C72_738570 [compost metagenome]